ncbi:MAG TPA: phosphate signaling complex protein PhoU, partial [Gemmatimonadaceae bacterium]|nr:phosphate signaling complex protein PhoU [Gemmatimonadaceae bacterium]
MTAEATASATGFRHFHDQLGSLKEQLLGMSAKAEERTDLAVEALLARDRDKANLVIDGDVDINRLEVDVEQAAVELLALQQPMARDLRFIIGAIKVSNDLERVGDHAVNIAESAIRLADMPKVNIKIPEIEVMARRARKMLGDSLDAFIRADGALGRKVCREDDVVDALHDSVFRVLLT